MGQQNQIGTHKTNVRTASGTTSIRYHDTDVVAYNSHHIWLDSGGWQTSTTKTRINQTSNQFDLGYIVFQKNFEWFVEYKGKTIPFTDNMILRR